jgi:FkbM family methyltransferase
MSQQDPLAHVNRIMRLKEISAQLQILTATVGAIRQRALVLESDLSQGDAATGAFEGECFRQLAAAQHALHFVRGQGYGTETIAAEVACLSRFLPQPPRVAVDIGGNVGDYTAALRARWPALPVHVFEPSATNISKLLQRYEGQAEVRVNPYALSDFDGQATLHADVPGSGMGSLSQRDLRDRGLSFDASESVPVLRFESYWQDVLQGGPVDLVKLDIEGHELAALRGFGPALSAVRVMQFEFGGCNIDTRTYWKDFYGLLSAAGFKLYRITPLGPEPLLRYEEHDEFYSTTNFIAVRP